MPHANTAISPEWRGCQSDRRGSPQRAAARSWAPSTPKDGARARPTTRQFERCYLHAEKSSRRKRKPHIHHVGKGAAASFGNFRRGWEAVPWLAPHRVEKVKVDLEVWRVLRVLEVVFELAVVDPENVRRGQHRKDAYHKAFVFQTMAAWGLTAAAISTFEVTLETQIISSLGALSLGGFKRCCFAPLVMLFAHHRCVECRVECAHDDGDPSATQLQTRPTSS